MKTTRKPFRSKAGFADLYLDRYGSGTVEGMPDPDPDLFLIVAIPAYKEPDIGTCIRSLLDCHPPGVKWEIIVNVNYPETADNESIRSSMDSYETVLEIARNIRRNDVRVLPILSARLPARHAGVGLARKIAMDQAIARFNLIGRPEGIICGYDADTVCEVGYLETIVRFYAHHKGARTANIYFEHSLPEGNEPLQGMAITEYELYLRYLRLAIRETGHPHDIHSVGSAFSVRAKTYIRVNGMGQYKAGEDFYFLHKCILLGGFWEINETGVLPSARESDRVIFGTGASMLKQRNSEVGLLVYSLDSFYPLRLFFSRIRQLRTMLAESANPEAAWADLPESFRLFLQRIDAAGNLMRIFRDTAGEDSFRKNFFAWFNILMVVKYLNDVHKDFYSKEPVRQEASHLGARMGLPLADSVQEMLNGYRNYERKRGNTRIN
jgi:hypothetical protein